MRTNKIHSLVLSAALLLAAVPVQAGLIYSQTFSSGFANGGVIPDGDGSGWQNSQSVSVGSGYSITDVRVGLNVSSGWNGDLYAYLRFQPTAGGPILLQLMNRPGYPGNAFGYGDPGFNLTLSDGGTYANGIQTYQSGGPGYNGSGQLTGTWKPNDGTTTFGTTFGSQDPNGTWSLFFADRSAGNVSPVASWSLEIEAVPEPVNVALLIFGLSGGVIAVGLKFHRRMKSKGSISI